MIYTNLIRVIFYSMYVLNDMTFLGLFLKLSSLFIHYRDLIRYVVIGATVE